MKTDWEKGIYDDITHDYTILPKSQANTIIMIMQQEIKKAVNEVLIDNKKEVLLKRGIK